MEPGGEQAAASTPSPPPSRPVRAVCCREHASQGNGTNTQLSWKYDGRDPGQDRPGAVRVVVRMEVEKAAGYGA